MLSLNGPFNAAVLFASVTLLAALLTLWNFRADLRWGVQRFAVHLFGRQQKQTALEWNFSDVSLRPLNASRLRSLLSADLSRRPRSGLITFNLPDGMGLGNQMFVYASTLGVAAKYGLQPVIERRFYLNTVFNLSAQEIHEKIDWQPLYELAACRDSSTRFEPIAQNTSTSYKIGDYLSSWKHFFGLRRFLREHEFVFSRHTRAAAAAVKANSLSRFNCSQGYLDCLAVGVHVRRGDVLNAHIVASGYTVASKEWLVKAMRHFTTKYPKQRLIFLIVGNDPDWNARYLGKLSEIHTVMVPMNSRDVDMSLLSQCDHVVISTGSFGWWAGYLSGGDVVYMKGWAKPGSAFDRVYNETEYYPPSWTGV